MSEDAILKVLITKGVDVVTVAHGGYTIPAHLRTALDVRDPKCIVPTCGVSRNLEKDHRNSYNRTQVTKLDDLAHVCRWHQYQKTFLGYTYRGGPGTWEWLPPPDRDVDLSPSAASSPPSGDADALSAGACVPALAEAGGSAFSAPAAGEGLVVARRWGRWARRAWGSAPPCPCGLRPMNPSRSRAGRP